MKIEELSKFGIDDKLVKEYLDKVKNGEKIIAVTGSFSSGKSTFINAFIGKENFLASSNIECTPVLVDLLNENSDKILIKYNDGREEEVDLTEENIKFYTRDKDSYDKEILGLQIPCDSEFLSSKVHFIDTPGTSTPKIEQELITNAILKKSDIVLYVFDTVISQADLDRIEFIKQYSNQIIFIMTKIDEIIDGELVSFSKDKIRKLSEEATKEISKVYENPSILPVSSKLAFKEPELIDAIREMVKFIADRNNEKKLKENAKKQIKIIFEERLNELREEISVEEQLFYLDLKKSNKSEEKLKRELENLKISNHSAINELNRIIKENKNKNERKLSIIYNDAVNKVLKNIEGYEDITEEDVDYEIEQVSKYINVEIKKFLDNSVQAIVKDIYAENKKALEQINTDLGIKIESDIKMPSIEEVVLESREIDFLKDRINSAESEVAVTLEEINYIEDDIKELNERLNQNNEKKQDVNNEVAKMGIYTAKYNEVVEEGYGEVGRRVGSVIGEIADTALIFAPGVGALKTADKVKDGIKIAEYATRSMLLAAGKSSGKKGNKIKKGNKVISILSMLSISKYAGDLGGFIGEAIKPTKVRNIEDEEYKNAWKSEENRLKTLKDNLLKEENRINEDFDNCKISMIEAKKKITKLQEEKKRAEEELIRVMEEREEEKEKLTKKQIKDHYKKEVEKVLSNEFDELKPAIDEVLGQVSENTIVISTEQFNKKIESLKESIERVCDERDKSEEVLNERKALLNELKGYSEWIDSWIG
ncbi:dynamin family protein [Clostridium perfringens]|uniref:dynamin family protein n=3 Tax=Clostridium perfringens TaxID=1502 RepID=UPI0018E42527|nr:dynamin family protein [Clostridium perfringens]MBI5999303.1 dynamin family protein [Clostridium perfringens]MDK0567211.1 dynamin family protein [Clostridium perfringens]MDK0982657.1 dynamin family protein [Clostridium perfringens]